MESEDLSPRSTPPSSSLSLRTPMLRTMTGPGCPVRARPPHLALPIEHLPGNEVDGSDRMSMTGATFFRFNGTEPDLVRSKGKGNELYATKKSSIRLWYSGLFYYSHSVFSFFRLFTHIRNHHLRNHHNNSPLPSFHPSFFFCPFPGGFTPSSLLSVLS